MRGRPLNGRNGRIGWIGRNGRSTREAGSGEDGGPEVNGVGEAPRADGSAGPGGGAAADGRPAPVPGSDGRGFGAGAVHRPWTGNGTGNGTGDGAGNGPVNGSGAPSDGRGFGPPPAFPAPPQAPPAPPHPAPPAGAAGVPYAAYGPNAPRVPHGSPVAGAAGRPGQPHGSAAPPAPPRAVPADAGPRDTPPPARPAAAPPAAYAYPSPSPSPSSTAPSPGAAGYPGQAAGRPAAPLAPGPVPADVPPGAAASPVTVPPPAVPHAVAPAADPAVARRLKRRVAAELHRQLSATGPDGAGAADSAGGPDPASLRQRGRALIEEAVARWSEDYSLAHGVAPTREADRALAEAVYDILFRAGRLQPYLDDPEIENIVVNGCDDVWVSRADEPLHRVPPIADSDEELVELLQDLARRHGGGERLLSTSHPTLALRLEGGMRLQAMIAVTPRPYVAIRRHRVASATLGDLERLGSIDSTLAAFLAACIRARKNVMITGTQGVGKTSLLRAMAAEIPPHERIGTLETEYELWLHELGRLHQVVPMEAREGNGERVDGRAAGEISLGDLIPAALRMTLTRIIVGEVRSSEVVPMLRVMTNGEGGSMCTLHARAPHMIVDRIAELCLEYGPRMTDALAYRLTSNALDFVVHLAMVDETGIGGRRHRYVSHVLEMTGLGENGRPAMNTVFAPRPADGEPRAVPHTPPTCLDDLRRAGFDPGLLDDPGGSWTGPLALKVAPARPGTTAGVDAP